MSGILQSIELTTQVSQSYEEHVGRFVDAVQLEGTDFERLRDEWMDTCPDAWRDQFAEDLREIEILIANGAFAA